jgi:N-glycosylase/DNA lyase
LVCSEEKLSSISIKRIDSALTRILGLKEDTEELFEIAKNIGRLYPGLIKKGAGRLLRGATLWEDAAKTLFTTNCSWALTQRMCAKICSSTFSIPSPSGRFPFPNPSSVARENPESLKRKLPIGYRAEYLMLLSSAFSKESGLAALEERSLPYDSAYAIASGLKGFGRYASIHLLILAGYYERIPVDSEVIRYIKKNYSAGKTECWIDRRYAPWGRYRWWGFKFEKMLRRQNWLGD